ncbi:MAG: MarR family winged helix-turn-helix transcriptional regulator [Bacteroidota bacterium]
MRYHQIQKLIGLYGNFEESTGMDDIQSFGRWLTSEQNQENLIAYNQFDDPQKGPQTQEEQISMGLIMLANHARHYLKAASRGTELAGWNDTIMMLLLFHTGAQRKTTLIKTGIIDISAGIEAIKRLVRRRILKEESDPTDKRAKLVILTEKGKDLAEIMDARIDLVSQIIAGNLSPAERSILLPLIFKLVNFHAPIFHNDYGAELNKLAEKYLQKPTE